MYFPALSVVFMLLFAPFYTSSKAITANLNMKVIGVTGGIASGKSTVSKILRDHCGAAIIDADKLGHESYLPGQPCHEKLIREFGDRIISDDYTINRKVLAGIVFDDPSKRMTLQSIVWPEIKSMARDMIRNYSSRNQECVVLEAAVMLEAGWEDIVDQLWVVSTDQNTAIERLEKRNGLTEHQALARINSQMSNNERESKADVVIHTNGTLEELENKVVNLFNLFK
mmetsp:Transcript_7091/g.9944  ORF Transcript_7091/g.9944 Transcript_7091/m.9944 type:complete len:227 (-) Transcript_7091:22-702(-)